MLFATIRLIFFGIAFTISFFFIRKSHLVYKRRCSIVAFAATVILTTISALIPIENAFVTFSSPKSAYNYNHSASVELIVDGNESDFVVGAKGETDVYAIVPRSNNAWKIGMGLDTKRIVQTISDGITIYVYQYNNTNDYYITVLDTNGGSSEITDNRNSKFEHLDKANSTLNKTFYTYFAFIDSFDEQYALTVNGKSIKIQD